MSVLLTAEIAAFTIMFREALEAALVISIISTYLAKIGRKEQIKYLWYGTIIAIVASLALGGSILVIYSTLSGIAEEIFEGVTSLIAAGVLTFMIVWMAKNAKSLKKEIQQRIDSTLTGRQIFGIASLAFIVVFREGLETVLFLTALVITDTTGSIIGISTALVSVSVLAILIWKGAYRLDVRKFFKVCKFLELETSHYSLDPVLLDNLPFWYLRLKLSNFRICNGRFADPASCTLSFSEIFQIGSRRITNSFYLLLNEYLYFRTRSLVEQRFHSCMGV